jgi:hypothetical protein
MRARDALTDDDRGLGMLGVAQRDQGRRRGRGRRSRVGDAVGLDPAPRDARSLLVNHWYAHPVGHAIEALRYCLGYHKADPSLQVSVLLNGATPSELGGLCPFIEDTFAVGFTNLEDGETDPAPALRVVPQEWDWVVDEHRSREDFQLGRFPGLRRFYEASGRYFRPRCGHGIAGLTPPAYEPHHQLRLELPGDVRERAERQLGHETVRIAVMPAGSARAPGLYPSVASWQLIFGELANSYPDAIFCLVGKLRRNERTSTAITRGHLDRIAAACPIVLDCFDWPLLEQLAIIERCHVFLSPHTGFGMAAAAVGTPWLTLSGGRWYEAFFNGVPFCSVIPDTSRYPCFPGWEEPLPLIAADVDGEGSRTPSMSRARIAEDLPELLEGALLLIERRLSYEAALERYYRRLVPALGGDRERIWSFDGAHVPYVWAS